MQFWTVVTDAPRILVVDDEVLIAWNLALELEELGAEVIGPFHTLDDALAGAAGAAPDMAILDINLHDRKVWPLAHLLAERGVPILFVSANFDTDYIGDHFPGAQALSKPVSRGALKRVVTAMTGMLG